MSADNWNYKKIKKWTNKDVCDWVKSIGLPHQRQATMVEAFGNTWYCTGQDLLRVKNGTDLANSFDINQRMLANRLYREFKKVKQAEIRRATSKAAAVAYMRPPAENKHDAFELQLFGLSKYWKIPQKVTVNTTIRRVKELWIQT
eukprot:428069_1